MSTSLNSAATFVVVAVGLVNACGGQVTAAGGSSLGGSSGDATVGSGGANADGALGGNAGADADGPSVTLADAIVRLLKAITCNPICYPYYYAQEYESQDDCVADWLDTKLFAWPGVSMTAEQIMACLAAIDVGTCTDFQNTFVVSRPDECRFKGTLSAGASCMSDWQCQSGDCNLALGSGQFGPGLCGKCTATIATLGQACDTAIPCQDGIPCIDGVCTKPKQAGEPCDFQYYNADCAWPLACVSGTCTPPLEDGEVCDPPKSICAIGSHCDTLKLVCESSELGQLGEPCWYLADGTYGQCLANAYCEHGNGEPSVCRPQIPVGQACPQSFPDSCRDRSLCLDGTCRLIEPSLCD